MTAPKEALVSLSIAKGRDYRTPIQVTLSVEFGDGPEGRMDVGMDAEQFAHFLSGTAQKITAEWSEYL